MKKISTLLALLMAVACVSTAQADTYNPTNNQLTIDSVQVGNTVYTGVVVTIGSVISVGGTSTTSSTVAAVCDYSTYAGTTSAASKLTVAAFNAVQQGMTMAQVSQILGCQPNPSQTFRYATHSVSWWGSLAKSVMVIFDASGSIVKDPDGGNDFKGAIGLY